ncbi:dienelactone hydrolase family protein [Actinoalloteichus caeruleus]|uniref:Carboxymethylenebutenolidase n=1 Tax=Actinoalloteichus caeruleus DSM 43889 TaxID=1120930 RepID=A0ABT1JKU0_ACTCY|nr:dienelactone hydrolase family protein [Actinoalloteichus caeruleus]MCP2332789.1 carboxymethylenebutenolidase [Actinoalloteichus caeruleus DSM 43889]
MTQTRTETVPLTDGRELTVTVAEPENTVRGGLVLLHGRRGVVDQLRELAVGLAAEGWLVAAPHLGEDRSGHDGGTGDQLLADTDAACVWLVDRGVRDDQLGLLGFGAGGTAALRVATQRSLGAVVSVAPDAVTLPDEDDGRSLVELVSELSCPWLALYGSDDESDQGLVRLRDAVDSASAVANVVTYPESEHRFDQDGVAASEAWQRTLTWFDAHLR